MFVKLLPVLKIILNSGSVCSFLMVLMSLIIRLRVTYLLWNLCLMLKLPFLLCLEKILIKSMVLFLFCLIRVKIILPLLVSLMIIRSFRVEIKIFYVKIVGLKGIALISVTSSLVIQKTLNQSLISISLHLCPNMLPLLVMVLIP